jgi:acetyl-CoA acetyltransferase
MAATMIAAGVEDIVMSCGIEMMSRIPLGHPTGSTGTIIERLD